VVQFFGICRCAEGICIITERCDTSLAKYIKSVRSNTSASVVVGGCRIAGGATPASPPKRERSQVLRINELFAEAGVLEDLHLAAALPGLDWGLSITNQYLADDIVTRPLRVVEGHAEVPGGVGLGVEVDESKVRKYQRAL
jgi:hypothetical protein